MCGIFGYVGKDNAARKIIDGLKRLEYRGYDSWGVAVINKKFDDSREIKTYKEVGPIGDLEKLIELKDLPNSHMGIGHTRWATHGGVTYVNAHPHYSSDKTFVLAQNGIVENYQELKKMLTEKGYEFESQTDTEVIVHLVEEKLKETADIKTAVRNAFLDLKGRNTIIILKSDEDHVIAVRNGSPLVIGVGFDEYFFASDTLSFANKTNKVIFMNDMEMAEYKNGTIRLYDVKVDSELQVEVQELDHEDINIDKEGYDHFMLKEIVEQKHTIRTAVQYSEEDLADLVNAIKSAGRVYTIGAGTAGFAAGQISYYLRKHANINATALKSYEFDSYLKLFDENDLIIAVSQSGETADTVEALEQAKQKGMKIASIVNMIGSTTSRISDFPFLSRSGAEICVASTKAFTAQVSWGLLLAMTTAGRYSEAVDQINMLAGSLESYLTEELFNKIKELVDKISDNQHFFVLGKGQNFSISLEGALKIKEITYKHFEGFAAGELKHGVIALIDQGTPVFVIVSDDEAKADMLNAAAEVKARGAYIIGIADQENELFDFTITTPNAGVADAIANVVPFQLISYFMGVKLGNSPDKPRNLAKSVTVK